MTTFKPGHSPPQVTIAAFTSSTLKNISFFAPAFKNFKDVAISFIVLKSLDAITKASSGKNESTGINLLPPSIPL